MTPPVPQALPRDDQWYDPRDWSCADLPSAVEGACRTGAEVVRDGLVKTVASSAWEAIVAAFMDGMKKTTEILISAWMYVPTQKVGSVSGERTGSPAEWVQDHLLWLTAAVTVASLLIAAGRMAWERRGDAARDAARGVVTLIVVTGFSLAVVANLVVAGDKFGVWLVEASLLEPTQMPSTLGARVAAMTAIEPALGGAVCLILAMLGILGGLVQIALLVLRYAMLVLLCGVLPLAASASSTTTGREWLGRCIGWLIAFILYKPAAGIVYATAFLMFNDRSSVLAQVTGTMLIALSCLTLPVLLRFTAPMTSQLASGGGMASAVGSAAGQALVATGAKAVPALMGCGAGAGRDAAGGQSSGGNDSGQGAGAPEGAQNTPPPGAQPTPPGGDSGGSPSPDSGPSPAPGGAPQGADPAQNPGSTAGSGTPPPGSGPTVPGQAGGPAQGHGPPSPSPQQAFNPPGAHRVPGMSGTESPSTAAPSAPGQDGPRGST